MRRRGRHPADGLRRGRRRRWLRLDRGRARPRRRLGCHAGTGAAPVAPAGAPERLRQDPGHARRSAGHRGGDRRGDQHQHHADVQRRRLPRRGARVHRRPAAAAGRRRRDPAGRIGRVASSSAGSTPRSTRRSTRSAPTAALAARGQAAIANAKLAYHAYKEIFEGGEFADLRGRRGARPALPVGEHLDQEPRLPRRACTPRS